MGCEGQRGIHSDLATSKVQPESLAALGMTNEIQRAAKDPGLQTCDGSMEARGAPEGEAAEEEKEQKRPDQEEGGSPMQGHLRDASRGRKKSEDGCGCGDEEPVPCTARRVL